MATKTLGQARILGGVGSILVLLSFVPDVGFILGIVGFILVLIAIKHISDATGDKSIFMNYLIAVIISIVGLIIVGVIFATIMMSMIPLMVWGPGPMIAFEELLFQMIAALIILWIISVVSAYFIRRSFNAVSQALNINLFRTAALLYFIGAILLIILVGAIIVLVALILQIIAFFQISGEGPPPPPPPPPPPTFS